jgi:endonuclease/exonuclease/phosphatase family metal-dependent hydrolase
VRLFFNLAILGLVGVLAPSACARLNHPAPKDASAVHRNLPDKTVASTRFRVATYNVHMESSASIIRAIQHNERLSSVDLLLLQEIEAHADEGATRAEKIAAALEMSVAYAPGYGLPGGGSHGVAILSRFPLRDIEVIELPYFHVVVNSARRAALAASITLGDEELRVYSVHLDNRINPGKRAKQMAPVLESARSFAGPVIIAGDLNTSPFCWAGSLVPLPCGLQDNVMEAGARSHELQSPVADIGATSKWFAMKLDAVYTRGLVPGQSGVEHSVRLSDHLPMWIDLELEP